MRYRWWRVPATRWLARAARSLALPLALVGVLAGVAACSGSGPPTFTTTFPAPTGDEGLEAMPVSLVDQTGLVTGIAPASGPVEHQGVRQAPGVANAVRVEWLGGPCDDRATLVFGDIGSGYEVAVHNDHPIVPVTCPAGTIGRALTITFNGPIDPTQVSVNERFP